MHDEFSTLWYVPRFALRFMADEGAGGPGSTDADEAKTEVEGQADPPAEPEGDAVDWKAKFQAEAAQSKSYRKRAQKAEKDIEDMSGRVLSPEDWEHVSRALFLLQHQQAVSVLH